MPQLSLYLDESSMSSLRERALREDVSISKFVGNLVRNESSTGWPAGFWDLYGAADDDSFAVPPELDFASDSPRGSWD